MADASNATPEVAAPQTAAAKKAAAQDAPEPAEQAPVPATNQPPEGAEDLDVVTAAERTAYPWEAVRPQNATEPRDEA